MANQSQKKVAERNKKKLQQHLKYIAGVNAAFVLYRILFHFGTFGTWHWIGFAVTSFVYYKIYSDLSSFARVDLDEKGQIDDAGQDLDSKGIVEYYFDVLYITLFVQAGTMISDWFWLVYLVIPAFALYKAWVYIIYPWWFAKQEEPEEMDEKKRRKMERREARAAQPRMKVSRR
eukprot:tig00000042_g15582.t1